MSAGRFPCQFDISLWLFSSALVPERDDRPSLPTSLAVVTAAFACRAGFAATACLELAIERV